MCSKGVTKCEPSGSELSVDVRGFAKVPPSRLELSDQVVVAPDGVPGHRQAYLVNNTRVITTYLDFRQPVCERSKIADSSVRVLLVPRCEPIADARCD